MARLTCTQADLRESAISLWALEEHLAAAQWQVWPVAERYLVEAVDQYLLRHCNRVKAASVSCANVHALYK